MISFRTGTIDEVLHDDNLRALLELHYAELTRNKEIAKLAPDWIRYRTLEDNGYLLTLLAFEGTALIGYSVFILSPHLHYMELKVALNDVMFLHPAHRLGYTGVRLIRESEKMCRAAGAGKICWHVKPDTTLQAILNRLGYDTEEVMQAKVL